MGGRNVRERAVLLIARSVDADPLRSVADWATGSGFRVAVADGIDEAVERLRAGAYDAVLLDLETTAGSAIERLGAVRELTGSAALFVRGGSPQTHRGVDMSPDEWIHSDDSASAISGCIRGAVELRRLRDELQARSAELAESEARFRNIIERTADGIVIVDQKGRVRFANPGAERLFARTAEELLDQDFGVAVVSGETTEMDIVQIADEQPVIAELRVSATTWEGSAAQIISLRDITDRKRADERAQRLLLEQAAREQAERSGRQARILVDASAILNASLNVDTTLVGLAEGIVPRFADWCVIYLAEGDRIRRVAGVHSDPGKQELLEELKRRFPPHADSPQPFARVLRSGRPELHRELDPEDFRALTEDESHAELLSRLGMRSSMTVPLEARETRLGAMTFVCVDRDFDDDDLSLAGEIASRAARALDNARLFEAALDANRVKSDFLAVMSHELRTPLTAILGFTDLLIDGIGGAMNEKQSGYLQRIRAGATRLLEIIGEILTYAQTEAGREQARPKTIRIGALIDEVVAIAEPMIREKGMDFKLEVDQRDATLYTDVGKLRQIMLSLLTNAAKFTDSGSVELRVGLNGEELAIAVSDTGIGIVPEELEEIFEPFRQVEQGNTRRAGGTGLGLSLSRRLAELLGGELEVESSAGQGSTFTLRVPSGTAAAAALPEGAA